jgi:hypothetical protein
MIFWEGKNKKESGPLRCWNLESRQIPKKFQIPKTKFQIPNSNPALLVSPLAPGASRSLSPSQKLSNHCFPIKLCEIFLTLSVYSQGAFQPRTGGDFESKIVFGILS